MALAEVLMGFGMNPALAQEVANAGTGPVAITSAGTSQATAKTIYGSQFVTAVTALGGTGGCLTFASPTGANAPNIADEFVVHNATSGGMTVYPPVGVTINVGGAAFVGSNPFTLATLKTLIVWTGPTTTQWFGVSA